MTRATLPSGTEPVCRRSTFPPAAARYPVSTESAEAVAVRGDFGPISHPSTQFRVGGLSPGASIGPWEIVCQAGVLKITPLALLLADRKLIRVSGSG